MSDARDIRREWFEAAKRRERNPEFGRLSRAGSDGQWNVIPISAHPDGRVLRVGLISRDELFGPFESDDE